MLLSYNPVPCTYLGCFEQQSGGEPDGQSGCPVNRYLSVLRMDVVLTYVCITVYLDILALDVMVSRLDT